MEPSLTFNVGVVVAGTDVAYSDDTASGTAFGKPNVIARDFVARGDLRYLTPEQGERVKRRMREIVATSLPGSTATIAFRDGYPPMPPTEAGARLMETYSRTSQDAGLGPIGTLDPALRGAGDVQFAAPYTVGIDGLGAAGNGAHTDDEDLEVASIERGAIRAALFIYRLTRP
jgi:glutamate carboxypeptidase